MHCGDVNVDVVVVWREVLKAVWWWEQLPLSVNSDAD